MDIERLKQLRIKLAADISELVNSFQRETNCTVKTVDLTHLVSDAASEPIATQVEVRIEIP